MRPILDFHIFQADNGMVCRLFVYAEFNRVLIGDDVPLNMATACQVCSAQSTILRLIFFFDSVLADDTVWCADALYYTTAGLCSLL